MVDPRFRGVYATIHALPNRVDVGCPYAEVLKHEAGFYCVYCNILQRLLTRYEVDLCRTSWRTCPYREMYEKICRGRS